MLVYNKDDGYFFAIKKNTFFQKIFVGYEDEDFFPTFD